MRARHGRLVGRRRRLLSLLPLGALLLSTLACSRQESAVPRPMEVVATKRPTTQPLPFVYAVDPVNTADGRVGPPFGSTCYEAQEWVESFGSSQFEFMRVAIRLDAIRYTQVVIDTIQLKDIQTIPPVRSDQTHMFTCDNPLALTPGGAEGFNFPTDTGVEGARMVDTLMASSDEGERRSDEALEFGFPFQLQQGRSFTFPLDIALGEDSKSVSFRIELVAQVNGAREKYTLDDHGLPFELYEDQLRGSATERPIYYWLPGSGTGAGGVLREICREVSEDGTRSIVNC